MTGIAKKIVRTAERGARNLGLGNLIDKVGRMLGDDSEEEEKKKLALMAASGGQKPVGMKKGGAVKRRRGDGIARRGRTRG